MHVGVSGSGGVCRGKGSLFGISNPRACAVFSNEYRISGITRIVRIAKIMIGTIAGIILSDHRLGLSLMAFLQIL